MRINNIEGLSVSQIREMVNDGGKFVYFPFTISIIIMTFNRSSDIYFIRSGENTIKYSFGYVLLNFFFGWWSFPWGPINTIGCIYRHILGGKDITQPVLSDLIQNDPEADTASYGINNIINPIEDTASAGQTYNIPR
jgi:hypothetical protein